MADAKQAMPRAGPVRVLHIHSSFDPGGKELRCVQLINRWGPAVAHSIVSATPNAMGAARLIARGIPVLQLKLPSLSGWPGPRKLQALAAAMRGYDLILTYNWGSMNAVLAHSAFGPGMGLAPLVHHEDGFNADEAVRLLRRRNLFRMLALARAQALVVPSRRLEAVALQEWSQPREKVHRISNGIDTPGYAKKPKRDALPRLIKRPGELWLGTFAGLREVKNLPRLVRAFADLPEPWQLVIAGEGPERAAIEAEAERLGLADRVHLVGFVTDPALSIGLFDLFALSSESEQFPVSVVEAMAAGLAVASPDVGDVAAMLSPDNAPYVTAPGDNTALAAAIAQLAADPVRRAAIGSANRAKARAEFDAATMAERYARVYGSVMKRASFP